MKKLIAFCLSLSSFAVAHGQAKQEPRLVFVNENISTHFISPEPITYVDISTADVAGDLPVTNILRVKPKSSDASLGIVTIVGERFMVQYKLVYGGQGIASSEVRIDPTEVDDYLNPAVSMSTADMEAFALQAVTQRPGNWDVGTTHQKMKFTLNNIYTIGDYFFIDVSLNNKTNLQYDIDQIRFKIEDKKQLKSTNFQQLEIEPVYQLYDTKSFKRKYRNVFVFKKFTFPEEKVFNIEVSESQISGRTISLKVQYIDVLNADTL